MGRGGGVESYPPPPPPPPKKKNTSRTSWRTVFLPFLSSSSSHSLSLSLSLSRPLSVSLDASECGAWHAAKEQDTGRPPLGKKELRP